MQGVLGADNYWSALGLCFSLSGCGFLVSHFMGGSATLYQRPFG